MGCRERRRRVGHERAGALVERLRGGLKRAGAGGFAPRTRVDPVLESVQWRDDLRRGEVAVSLTEDVCLTKQLSRARRTHLPAVEVLLLDGNQLVGDRVD